jgi:hypothetical protein
MPRASPEPVAVFVFPVTDTPLNVVSHESKIPSALPEPPDEFVLFDTVVDDIVISQVSKIPNAAPLAALTVLPENVEPDTVTVETSKIPSAVDVPVAWLVLFMTVEFVIVVVPDTSKIPFEPTEPVPVAMLFENVEFVNVPPLVPLMMSGNTPEDADAVLPVTVEFEIVNGPSATTAPPGVANAPLRFPPESVKLSSTKSPLLVDCTTRAPEVPWCTVTPFPSTDNDDVDALNNNWPLVKLIVPNPGVTVIVFDASALALASMNA